MDALKRGKKPTICRIHHRRAARFCPGRCFVLGDAAHIHSPVGAQGTNTGLQDAYNRAVSPIGIRYPDSPLSRRRRRCAVRRATVPNPSYYLLRPDGHVGLTGIRPDAAALGRYFAGCFIEAG